tara:strand:+ start:955 stop:1377 length:423 start_codon:yes stop_codon:yes gene_type:complete
MAIKKLVQYNRNNEVRGFGSVVGKATFSEMTEAGITATEIVSIPAGALITGLYIDVAEAFDGGATIDVGISTDTDKFYNDLDITTAGITKGTGVDVKTLDITRILLTHTVTGTPTTGKLSVYVTYADLECVTGNYVESGK